MQFSIIVPAYNAQNTIADTLQSLLEQKVTPEYTFEIIIINDGSSDATLKVCEYYSRFYQNIAIYTQENGGLTKARNVGASKARGEVLLFVDSDDMLPPNTLWNYYLVFSNYAVDFVAGLMGNYWEHNKTYSIQKNYLKGHKGFLEDKSLWVPIFANACSACTKAYKKEFLNKHHLRFLDGHHLCEDHLWTLSLLKYAKSIFLLDEVVFYYRMHPNNSVSNWKKSYLEDMIAVQEGILKLQIPLDLDCYYRRFLKDFDFKKHLIEQAIIGQGRDSLEEMVKPLQKVLETIPLQYQQKHMPKWYAFKDHSESGIYKEMLRIRRNRKIKRFAKRLKNPFIKPLKNFFGLVNGLWYRRFLNKYQCRDKLLKALYQSFLLLPIKKGKITFSEGAYGMKYLGAIKEVLLSNSEFFVKTIPNKTLLSADIKRMYHFAKSQVILIDDYHRPLFGITPRKETLVLQCWHAGGLFKKFGCDSAKNNKEFAKEIKWHQSYSYAFVSGREAIEGYMSAFNLKREQIKLTGNIATDMLIKNQRSQMEAKVLLGVNPKKKLLVYAPTFRDWDRPNFNLNLNFQALIEKYGDKYEFAIRIHPSLKPTIPLSNVYDFSLKEEWLVLNAADALIADYSSIIFTYAYFGRPIYFYPYDYPKYMGERGFYKDYLHFVPGDIAFSEEELLKLLENIPQTSQRVQKLWKDYMGECDGNTAQKIANFIKDKVEIENV
ncbi:bifunctional glycosyltransferase/CDP-glycerol:glycerophosphate glycerophosphotransferase [Helicobacter turcicus]|uniref:Bifunctional glycosyltransferase family 2 protein/CDP-glycerol:glycerophosphate glycerophosphotransferase n=1 Tax=Helicobacter turcicus TaxID=2867412 RepID=A0ABS7JPU5_9HELI|nr:CDP-glycerol glycerophosphotransferase family protein [Helicobacter turcicus]MBX7491431.1 bifunctional glycosyltransferase family 2 protein/CDP-glycerol:glycerophosphate glycerophosphotransferase [Helicobacter turcicus]